MGKNAKENYQITNLLMAFDDMINPIFAVYFVEIYQRKKNLLRQL